MSRNAYLSSVISLPAKIIANRENKSSNSCDTYRSVEWSKYSTSYHNLLYSDPMSKTMQTKGFFDITGEKYKTEYKYNLNLARVIKDSLVNRPKMVWLPCIDERIQYLTASHHALSLGLPGCECSMSESEKLKMAYELVNICKNNSTIEEIVVSSHSKCGAVAHTIANKTSKPVLSKIWDKFQDKDKVLDSASERYASGFADILKTRLKEYNSNVLVRTHHFHFQELHSQNLHNAFGAIINFNPLLNSAELEENLELPMFNIYAGGQKPVQILNNIELALRISTGEHGFSNIYFNKENPFILLFTIDNKQNPNSAKFTKSIIKKLQEKDLPLEVVYSIVETA